MPNKDDDNSRLSGHRFEERPMTLPVAVMWSFLATGLLVLLLFITQEVRTGAHTDIINGLACTAAAYLMCIFLMARAHASRWPLSSFLGIRPTHPLLYLLAAGLGVCLEGPAELIRWLIERRWPTPIDVIADQVALYRVDTTARRIIIPIVVVCLGPLIEELFYRGALHQGLRKNYRSVPVVVGVATLFALGHVDPRAMAPIFLVGLFLGIARASTGSLLPPLITHMSFNAVVVIGLLSGTMSIEHASQPLPLRWTIAGLAGTVVMTLAILGVASRSSLADHARREDTG